MIKKYSTKKLNNQRIDLLELENQNTQTIQQQIQ
jgi:hypothetical protein